MRDNKLDTAASAPKLIARKEILIITKNVLQCRFVSTIGSLPGDAARHHHQADT